MWNADDARDPTYDRIAARATEAFAAQDVRYAGSRALPTGLRTFLSAENMERVGTEVAARLRDPDYVPPLELAEVAVDELAAFGRPLVHRSDVRWLNAMVVDRVARDASASRARSDVYERWVLRGERERFLPPPTVTRERHAGTELDVTARTLASTMPSSWRARVARELADS